MRRILDLTRYPAIVVFLLAGLLTLSFAFASYNLFMEASANLHFLRTYGLRAVMEGGLVQLAMLGLYGLLALFCYIVFKICERDLVERYRSWIGRPRD